MIREVAPKGAAAVLLMAVMGAPGAASDDLARAAALPDVCLAVAAGALPDGAWDVLVDAVEHEASQRAELFPDPTFTLVEPDAVDQDAATMLQITADVSHAGPDVQGSHCRDEGGQWSLRVARTFLDEGADRMLAAAPTTPGIASSVEVEWFPDEARVLTSLTFAGPLDIPNGRCWIDDALSVDALKGIAVSTAGHGVETSPFAEGACGRFFDYLANGGAGEQAVRLLPTQVSLADRSSLTFVAQVVSVRADAIVVSGMIVLD